MFDVPGFFLLFAGVSVSGSPSAFFPPTGHEVAREAIRAVHACVFLPGQQG